MRIPDMDFGILFLIMFMSYYPVLGTKSTNTTKCREPLQRPKRAVQLNADVIIGGLFPLRLTEKNAKKCSTGSANYILMEMARGGPQCKKLNYRAVMWVEAMLFAICAINSRNDILPGVTLGYDIRDTANDVNYATKCSLDFIMPKKANSSMKSTNSNCLCTNETKGASVVAVVGGAGSKISKAINYILGVDDVPQISYSSTSPSLSDKHNFPSFLRTIPPDYIQAQVMADLISYYKWTYVSTIATDEDYGRLGIEALKREFKMRNICISVDELFHHDNNQPWTKAKIKYIAQKLKADDKANVVVLFCEGPNAFAVLEEAERQGLTGKTWIAPESWGDNIDALSIFKRSTIGGMLGVVPWKGDIEQFANHMSSLTPNNTDRNPWFESFWKGKYNCYKTPASLQENVSQRTNKSDRSYDPLIWKCPGYISPQLPNAGKLQLNKSPNVMDSVYAIALALHKMLNCTSRVTGSCSGSRIVPRDLLAYIKQSDFTGSLGYPIKFDKHGDTKGNYLIKSLQPNHTSPHKKEFVTIGFWRWIDSRLVINVENITWNSGGRTKPVSRCSVPCSQGEYPVQGGSTCCWTCVQCPVGYIKNTTGKGTCTSCEKGYTSDHTHSKCLELPILYLQWSEVTAIAILSLSAVGLITTAIVLCVYLKFSDTAIVKASTREFTFLMLIIIALMFALTALYIGKPTFIICQIRPFFFAFVITFWTSLMLTKTNRLLLIFKSKRIPVRDRILGIRFQLVLAVILTLFIIITALTWVLVYPPEVTYHYSDNHVIIDCGNQSDKLLIITLGYTAVLAIITTFLAYKARNLPENFNETRYIGFSMFTFCIIWLTYIPLYYGAGPAIKYVFLCCCLIVTGLSALICLFFNRLRIILFHPEENRTEVIRARTFVYTMRDKNGAQSTAARNMRRTSVVTVGNFSLQTPE